MGRSPAHDPALAAPRHWLVLPDEPTTAAVLALPAPAVARPALPVVAVVGVSWSSSDESWRAEKPFRPWLQTAGPYAATVAFGAVSLDLSALGMGIPEIFPTHLPVHRDDRSHGQTHEDHSGGLADESFDVWTPEHTGLISDVFDTHHGADLGFMHLAAWDQSDFIVPSWDRPHEASHDWWA